MESRTKNTTRNITFGVLYKIVTLLLPFVTRTLLLYLVGVSSVGISTLFTSILSFLSLAELGFGSAVVYSMYKPIAEQNYDAIGALLKYYKQLYRIIGLIILAIGCVISPFLPVLIKGDFPEGINIYILYFIYLANSVISYFVAGYRQSLLTGYQRSDVKDKIAMAVTIAVRFIEVVVIAITKDLYFYALVSVFGTITTNLLTAVVTKKMYPQIKCKGTITKEQRQIIRKKLSGLFGTKLNSIVVNQADTLVISAFLGLTVLAKYGNYYCIVNAVSGFIMVIFGSMTASIGNKITEDSKESIYKLFEKISFINTWVVGWCSICLLCLFQPFIRLWVGDELLLPFSTAVLMSLYLYIYQVQRTILTFKDAAGLWYEDRMRPYISMVLNVVSNIVLVNIIGLNGVIVSTIIAFFISIPWCNHVVFTALFQKKPVKNMIRLLASFVVTAIIGAVTYLLCNFFQDGLKSLVLRGIICVVVPNILYFIVYHKKSECKELVVMLKNLIYKCLTKLGYKPNVLKKINADYMARFNRNAFVDGKCEFKDQYEASMTRLYHTVEKGLSYENYRPGFGKDNINMLLSTMEDYSKKYDVCAHCYETAYSTLNEYVRKNKENGYIDEKLENRINNLPGKPNAFGGSIWVENPINPSQMNYSEFVMARHSIRHFSGEPVDIEKLKNAVALAQYTPSACNRQGWKTRIINDKKVMKDVLINQNGNRGFGQEFDKLLAITANTRAFQKNRELFQAFVDGGMYAQSVLNALFYYRIGAVPLSGALTLQQDKNVRKILKMEDGEVIILFVGIGNYPKNGVLTTRSERHDPDTLII